MLGLEGADVVGEDLTRLAALHATGVRVIDSSYQAARAAGAEIVHDLTDEPWGVRRFFVKDLDGYVINVLAHD